MPADWEPEWPDWELGWSRPCRRLGLLCGGNGGAVSASDARCGSAPFEELFEASTSGEVRPERVCGTSGMGDVVDVSPKSESRLCFCCAAAFFDASAAAAVIFERIVTQVAALLVGTVTRADAADSALSSSWDLTLVPPAVCMDATPSWEDAERGMNVCFWQEVPKTVR